MATTSELVPRLERGYDIAERAPPAERYTLEDHWIHLLRLYEAAHIRENKQWQPSLSPDDSLKTPSFATQQAEQASLL